MPIDMTNVSCFEKEYRELANDAGWGQYSEDSSLALIKDSLVKNAEWNPKAASELVHLARNYGSFMLRNALALAVALDIEDGKSGY